MTRDRQKRIRSTENASCALPLPHDVNKHQSVRQRHSPKFGTPERTAWREPSEWKKRQMVNCFRAGNKNQIQCHLCVRECVCVCVRVIHPRLQTLWMVCGWAVSSRNGHHSPSKMHQLVCTEMRYGCVQSFYNFLWMICWLQLLLSFFSVLWNYTKMSN